MNVATSGFYAWLERGKSEYAKRDERLLDKIKQFHHASKGRYGSPRIYDDLRLDGEHVGKKRVERLMRDNGIVGKRRRKFTCTTNSDHSKKVAEYRSFLTCPRKRGRYTLALPAVTSAKVALLARRAGAL